MRSQMLYTNGSFEICQEWMFVKQHRTHGWSTYLLSKKIFMLKQKSSHLYMIGSEWLFIHITLETASNEMQCDETISHMVTAGWSYFCTRRNACVTAGKTAMTAGKMYHGCFEMLSWPYNTSNNIINICFWLLETCTECSYFIEENMRPDAQWLAFEVKYEYIVHQSANILWGGDLRLGKFPDNWLLMC